MADYNPSPSAPPAHYPAPSAPPVQHVNPRPPAYTEVPQQSYGATGYQPGPGNYHQPMPSYQQPQVGYQPAPVYNTTANSTVTVVRSQPTLPTFRPPKPSSYLWLSVITMLCCCFVLGLIALIVGMEVDSAYNTGDDVRARSKSKQALGFSIAAIGVGLAIHLGWLTPVIYVFAVVYSYPSSTV